METYRFLVTKIVYYKPTSWYIYIHCNQAETSWVFFLQYSNNSHYRSSLWCVFQQHIHGNLPSDDLVPMNKNMGGRKETVFMLFHHRANELLRLCRNKPATRQNSQVSLRQQIYGTRKPLRPAVRLLDFKGWECITMCWNADIWLSRSSVDT